MVIGLKLVIPPAASAPPEIHAAKRSQGNHVRPYVRPQTNVCVTSYWVASYLDDINTKNSEKCSKNSWRDKRLSALRSANCQNA